jgi:hypothetical protein
MSAAMPAELAAQTLLPPVEHPFWQRPDAPEQALLATVALERERQSALAALEAAMARLTQLTQALGRFESDARAARADAAHAAAARATAEAVAKERAVELSTLKLRLRELETGAASGMASAAPGAAAMLAQRECQRLTEQLASKTRELAVAEARFATAAPGARERRVEAERAAVAQAASLAQAASQAAAGDPPRAPSPGAAALAPLRAELAAALAEADAARADREALRGQLDVERNRCRGLSRALASAEAAAKSASGPDGGNKAGAASEGGASATRRSVTSPTGRDGELDALRVELLEERLRAAELASALASRPEAGNASSTPAAGSDAELRKLRERCRQLQVSLDAETSRALDLQARWEATQRAPSPLTLQSRVAMHLNAS